MVLHLHHVPGRLRVCLAALKRNEPAATRLRSTLLELEGVQSVSVNSGTGSVILHYNRDQFEPESLWTTLRDLGHLDQTSQRVADRPQNATGAACAATDAIVDALAAAALEHLLGRAAGTVIRALI